MVDDYLGALRELDEFKNGSPTDEVIHEITAVIPRMYDGIRGLKNNCRRRNQVTYSPENVWATQYRPFVKHKLLCRSGLCKRPGPSGQDFPGVRQRKPCDLRSGNRIDQAILGSRGRYDAGS